MVDLTFKTSVIYKIRHIFSTFTASSFLNVKITALLKNPFLKYDYECFLNHSLLYCLIFSTLNCHVIFFHLFREGHGGCYHIFIPIFQGVAGFLKPVPVSLWAKPGYILDELPAHCRALTAGRGRHTRCQLHIRSNFGVQYLAQGYFDM